MADAKLNEFTIGDVIWLRTGLHCYHWQAQTITVIKKEVTARIESIRKNPHCTFIDVKVLNTHGAYYAQSAKLTFAQSGNFRPEFIMQDIQVLRKLPKPK